MNDVFYVEPFKDPAEDLPRYCNYFKYILVEELVLEPDYRQIHFGKCAVIGRLSSYPDVFQLENVTIPHLPSIYRLPTGALSLLLLNFRYDYQCSGALAHGAYCVVRGEVVLCNVQEPNKPTLTARGLHEQLLRLECNEEEKTAFLAEVTSIYKPALSVWHAKRIERAEELIQRRLEIRAICQKWCQ